jgi:hypothetical protein
MVAFEFCESTAGSSAGAGWTIIESANFANNPVAGRTAVTPGSANTVAWVSGTQQTILGTAVVGNPASNTIVRGVTVSGVAGVVYTKSGYGVAAGATGVAAKSLTDIDSGFAKVGAAGSGASQRAGGAVKTGYATAGGIGAGPSASVCVESGVSTAGGVGSGAAVIIIGGLSGNVYVEAGAGRIG